LLPLIEKKRKALINVKKNPTSESNAILRQTKATLQRESRRCSNEYWIELCTKIQNAADMGDSKSMFENIKIA
jgi:hypothetical protein